MKHKLPVVLTVLLAAASAATAQNFDFKTNNTIALTQAGSWSNNIVPGSGDWAIWNTLISRHSQLQQ